jgi:hypothetical protein
MDLKEIDRNIKAVKRNGVAWNNLVHTTAVAILSHAQEHGDCTRALALVEAMPKSTKRAALIEWFAEYSPIGMNVKERKVRFHKPDAKAYNPFDVEKATDNPWFDRESAKKEDLPDTTLEEAHKKLFKLAASFEKRLDDGEVAANDREAIAGVVADLKALAKKEYRKAKKAVAEQDKLAA